MQATRIGVKIVWADWSWRRGLIVPLISVVLLAPAAIFAVTNAAHPGALRESALANLAKLVPPSPAATAHPPAPTPAPKPPAKKPGKGKR